MESIKKSVKDICKKLFDVEVKVELSRTDEQFGDYATNIALQLGKQLNKKPLELAEVIVKELKHKDIASAEVAGPGFINLRLSDSALWDAAKMPISPPNPNKTVVIETNNPNPFKDMHIGHAYNSIIADTIANLLEASAGKVHRVSYHGDVGLHVGKTMWAVLRQIDNNPAKLAGIAEDEQPQFLSKAYKQGHDAYESDESAKAAIDELAQQSFKLSDKVFKTVYETCKAWSFAYFDSIFKQIGSKPIERRYLEREADEAGCKTVEGHIGSVFEKSDGAIIFPGEKYGPGLHTVVLITQRGNTLYSARDLGLIQLKTEDYKPDASYIVTAVEQKDYFQTILKAAELALPDLAINTTNIPTGTVKLSSGKMSSRKGTFVNIGWLIDEITKALKGRSSDANATQDAIIGALRYNMLKVRVGSDVIFDIKEAISLDGNSGPYLQYAYARAKSILTKTQLPATSYQLPALETGERSLVRKITEYPEALERAVGELMPHNITTYLYELAQSFNSFYEHNRVIGDEREALRLKLVQIYADVLKNGLEILNIPAPDRM